jgi:hypothetical protein
MAPISPGRMLVTMCFVCLTFGQSKPTAKETFYVIKEHTVVPSKTVPAKGRLPNEDFYIIEYGVTELRVKYAESQTSSASPGDVPGSGLHRHDALYNPDLSQVPNAGVPIRACTLRKDRDHDGDLVIAHQATDEPCMARIGDVLRFEPSPNGPTLFTYVSFDIVSEKIRK